MSNIVRTQTEGDDVLVFGEVGERKFFVRLNVIQNTSSWVQNEEQLSEAMDENKRLANPVQAEPACKTCKPNTGIKRIFSGGIGLAKAALELDKAEADVVVSRKATCMGCEHFDLGLCSKCGCWLPAKVKLASETCPEGKW